MRIRQLWHNALTIWRTAGERHIGLIAAGVAFFGMFGVFPGITAIVAVFGLLADPQVVAEQLTLMEDVIPAGAYGILQGQIDQVLRVQTGTLGWATALSLGLALWSARAAVAALMGGLNAIEDVTPRSGIWQAVVALTLTLCLVTLAVVALSVIVGLPVLIAFVPFAFSTVLILEIARWVVALAVLLGGLSLLYRFGPNLRGARPRWLSIGAVVVIVVWMAASAGLSYYLRNFGNYQAVYGSLAAVIGLLLWFYVSAYLVLLGAVLNAQIYGRPRDRGAEEEDHDPSV